jgi:hypothetical protein
MRGQLPVLELRMVLHCRIGWRASVSTAAVFAAWGMTSRSASFNIAGRMRL